MQLRFEPEILAERLDRSESRCPKRGPVTQRPRDRSETPGPATCYLASRKGEPQQPAKSRALSVRVARELGESATRVLVLHRDRFGSAVKQPSKSAGIAPNARRAGTPGSVVAAFILMSERSPGVSVIAKAGSKGLTKDS
jgi:hypothetical protein